MKMEQRNTLRAVDLAHATLLGTVFGWLVPLNDPASDALGDRVAGLAVAASGHQNA